MNNWIDEIIDVMDIGGKSLLLNILYDINTNVFKREVVCNFFRELEEFWTDNEEEGAFMAFSKTANLNDGERYLCQGLKINDFSEECSRIVDLHDFLNFNVDFTKVPFTIPFDDDSKKIAISILESLDPKEEIGKGVLRGKQGVVWVTKTEKLKEIYEDKTPEEKYALLVRNKLGLYHYPRGTEFIEIRYREKTVKEINLRCPTFLDGCSSEKYNHLSPVYYSLRGRDGWGRTLDLTTYKEGFPEAVHKPIEFVSSKFMFKYVGEVSSDPPPYNKNKFMDNLQMSWSDFRSENLLELINNNCGAES